MEIQIAGWDSRIHVICLGVPSYLVKYSITWFVCLNHSIGTLSLTEDQLKKDSLMLITR